MSEPGRSILIVDDEDSVRQSFVDYFEDRLWNCIPVFSAEEALKVFDKTSPEAALVDIRLTGMTGIELIEKIAKRHPSTVFVICTGSPDYDVTESLLALSNVSNRIFFKPVSDIVEIEQEFAGMLAHLQKNK